MSNVSGEGGVYSFFSHQNASEEKEEKQIIWNVDFLFSLISINKSDLSDIFTRNYSR